MLDSHVLHDIPLVILINHFLLGRVIFKVSFFKIKRKVADPITIDVVNLGPSRSNGDE